MIAVITGDIIQSTQIRDKAALLAALRKTAEQLVQKQLISPREFDIYRGDSFQLFVKKPETALKLILIIRASLMYHTPDDGDRLWDARVSIGLGTLEFRAKDIRQSSGSALIYSGRGLDSLKSRQKMKMTSSHEEFDKDINMGLHLAEYIISRWSRESAETIIEKYLNHATQKEIAKKFHISQPAVSKRFKAAGIDALDIFINRFEKKLQTIKSLQ